MDKTWHLKRINLFKEMSNKDIQHLSEISFMRDYTKKEVIYFPGDKGEKVYLLKKGQVKISKISDGGKEVTLVVLEQGEVFGEMALLDESNRQTIAEVLKDANICTVDCRDFKEFIAKHPGLSMKITKLIGLRRRELENKIEDLVFRTIPSRLANLLLKLSEKYGVPKDNGTLIKMKLTHYELATLIGTTRETTTMTLNDFKRHGLIDFQHRYILILDKAKLKKRQSFQH